MGVTQLQHPTGNKSAGSKPNKPLFSAVPPHCYTNIYIYIRRRTCYLIYTHHVYDSFIWVCDFEKEKEKRKWSSSGISRYCWELLLLFHRLCRLDLHPVGSKTSRFSRQRLQEQVPTQLLAQQALCRCPRKMRKPSTARVVVQSFLLTRRTIRCTMLTLVPFQSFLLANL